MVVLHPRGAKHSLGTIKLKELMPLTTSECQSFHRYIRIAAPYFDLLLTRIKILIF